MNAITTQTNLQKLYQDLEAESLVARSEREKQGKTQTCRRPGPRGWAPHLLAPGLRPGQPLARAAAGQEGSLGPWLLPGNLRR